LVRELIIRMSDGLEDPDRPGLTDTPRRVVDSWKQFLFGYTEDKSFVRDLLIQFPEDGWNEMVVVKGVMIYSLCEHHLLPFVGTAAVGYVPGSGKVVGLSKLARLVAYHAARLTTQERIAHSVTKDLMDNVEGVLGAACVVDAAHLCMSCRGAQEQNARTVTSSLKGVFFDKPEARAEFLSLARG
jgi:GTP cyclohydrolase I